MMFSKPDITYKTYDLTPDFLTNFINWSLKIVFTDSLLFDMLSHILYVPIIWITHTTQRS